MEPIVIGLGWVGIFGVLALSGIGSSIACARAGMAAAGAMLESESGYGRYVGASAMPSSQTIYGIVLLLALTREVTVENGLALFALGTLAGLGLMISSIQQGMCCASAITASKSKPEIFALSLAPAAIVEGFSVFILVFALVTSGNIPS